MAGNILHYIDFTDEYVVEFPCGHHKKIPVVWMHDNFTNSDQMIEYCAALVCESCETLSDEEEAEIQRQYEESFPAQTWNDIERTTEPIQWKKMFEATAVTPEKLANFITNFKDIPVMSYDEESDIPESVWNDLMERIKNDKAK